MIRMPIAYDVLSDDVLYENGAKFTMNGVWRLAMTPTRTHKAR